MSPGRVRDSWKDDALFGYQFLNGANPMLLRRCERLPARLVLPPGMKDLQTQLEKELKVLSCLCVAYAPSSSPQFRLLCLLLPRFFPCSPCAVQGAAEACVHCMDTALGGGGRR